MNKTLVIISLLASLLLPACSGYHLGGVPAAPMVGMKTYAVSMFANKTGYPDVAMLLTTALGNTMQSDGTFSIAPSSEADFIISGSVDDVRFSQSMRDWRDTELSFEVDVTVSASYTVIQRSTGKTLTSGTVSGSGSYFTASGNTFAGRESAFSYATRNAASDIVSRLCR